MGRQKSLPVLGFKENLRIYEHFFNKFSVESCYDYKGNCTRRHIMKKRMRQLAALGVAVMLVLGGCAEKPAEQTAVEKPVIEPEETAEPVEAPAEAEAEKETVPLSIHVDTKNKTYYFEDGDDAYLFLQYCDVSVEGEGYENLKRNIENWSLERSEGLRSLYASFEETAAEDVQDNESFDGYSLYQTVSVARSDERIVSLSEDTWQYTGGAHGTAYRDGITFDSQSGKQLALSDIFSDYENFKEDAVERIVSYLQENYGGELFEDYITTVEGLWEDDMEPAWYLDGSGIVIVLQEYSVGPYSIGMPEVRLSYSEFKQYIKEAYLPGTVEGTSCFKENQEIFLKLPKKEEEYPMMLKYVWKEDVPICSLWLGQNEKQLESFAALNGAYLVKSGEEVFCLVVVDMASDDFVTYVYRLTDGVIQEIAQIDGLVDSGNMNSQEIIMESYVYLLGTYSGVKTYTFDGKGGFFTADTEYQLWQNEYVLTTKTDLPVTLDGTESILPAGSRIVLNATDNETYVTFTIQETGQTGILKVHRSEDDYNEVTINGMSENDCFETLPYAG